MLNNLGLLNTNGGNFSCKYEGSYTRDSSQIKQLLQCTSDVDFLFFLC